MDKERAKFILQSYRPDGADAQDSDFTEALQLAIEDRDLGEWLADERADDAIFAEALSIIDIPDGLRNEILAVLQHDQSSGLENELDGVFFGAVTSVQLPIDLRDKILSAMEEYSNQQLLKEKEKVKKLEMNNRNLLIRLQDIKEYYGKS